MTRFLEWLKGRIWPDDAVDDFAPSSMGAPPRPRVGHKPALPKRQPEVVNMEPRGASKIVSQGPGKNVLIRNKYRREDTGTHETLKILDDSMLDSDEEQGFDPYNTGQFDRSKNWDRRTK